MIPVRLRLIDLTVRPTAVELGWLSERERARAARFRFMADRARYRAAHVAIRHVIAEATGLCPADLRFVETAHGKPVLAGGAGLYFSMSGAGDRVLIGISDRADVGVDLERVRPIAEAAELAAIHFTDEEQAAVEGVPPGPMRDRLFLQGWTRKEACVKMTGHGLSLHTASFASGVRGVQDPVRIPVGDAAGMLAEVGSMTPADDLIAAWAIRTG